MTGGFALAASRVWGKEHEIVSFVEIDPFCQKVLQKHWPDVPVYGDIKTYEHNETTVDLLTGGFPCQGFSVAGKQRGKKDPRYLWPEMLAIIKTVRPNWIIGENVEGIVKLALDTVLSDLESEGYTCQSFIIPACAVDAPHRRNRVWIVGHTINDTDRTNRRKKGKEDSIPKEHRETGCVMVFDRTSNDEEVLADTKGIYVQGLQNGQGEKQFGGGSRWLPEPSICELDDGLPPGLVRYRGRVATGVKDRVNKLKALGNSIVPQCVQPIMECIREIEDNKRRKERNDSKRNMEGKGKKSC